MQHYTRLFAVLLTLLLLVLPCFGAEILIPGGEAVGLELTLSDLCITTVEENLPADAAGLRAGDCIVAVDGTPMQNANALAAAISTGKPMIVTICRAGREMTFTVRPQQTENGWRIGAEVLDTVSGIGTITYFDPKNNQFGALGHGINLSKTTESLPVAGGKVCLAAVTEIVKGESGAPGELKGDFAKNCFGTVERVTDSGVFGRYDMLDSPAQAIPTAAPAQVHPGAAVIRCCLNGTRVQNYSVRIVEVYPTSDGGRDLLLEVTDKTLLSQTGGIVRGMSGSPIIQDGRLVGAVTHVLVDNPTRGYGIFIDKMRAASA